MAGVEGWCDLGRNHAVEWKPDVVRCAIKGE